MRTSVPSVVTIGIEGMSCGHCVARVTRALSKLPGFEIKSVALGGVALGVAGGADAKAALSAIEEAGFKASVLTCDATGGGG